MDKMVMTETGSSLMVPNQEAEQNGVMEINPKKLFYDNFLQQFRFSPSITINNLTKDSTDNINNVYLSRWLNPLPPWSIDVHV